MGSIGWLNDHDFVLTMTCINIFRLFMVLVACVYLAFFIRRLYRRAAMVSRVFWFVSEFYYAKQIVVMRKFYSADLHPYLLLPQPHIIKFFDVKQQQKKAISLNKFDSLNDSHPASFATYTSSFGSKSRLSEEFEFSMNEKKMNAPKYEELIRQCPKVPRCGSLFFRWFFSTTGKWLLLFMISIGFWFLNNLMMATYEKKISLENQLLGIKTNVGRLKALSDLWNYSNQRNATILDAYVTSRKTTLTHLYTILQQIASVSSATSSSEYIYVTMYKNLTQNLTLPANASMPPPKPFLHGNKENSNQTVNNSALPDKIPPDGFTYHPDGSLLYNYDDVNLVLEKGFKHSLLSLINTLDYYLLLPNTRSRGVDSSAWVYTYEEKLIEILVRELETARGINKEAIASFRLTFFMASIGSIVVMLVIFVFATRDWLRFHRNWKEAKFKHILNSLNLISDKEVQQNRALVRACVDVFEECGI
jgi:hypothetical protein